MERSQVLALLQKYNQEPFHIMHALTVEGVMRWYAQERAMATTSISGDSSACSTMWILKNIRTSTVKRHRNYWLKSTPTMPLSMPSSAMAMASVSMSHRST